MKKMPQELITQAQQNNRKAQKAIFENYAPALMSVCRLYITDFHFAEDILLKAFYKIFTHLHTYKEQEHFYAWMRKITVNECIDFLKSKQQKILFTD